MSATTRAARALATPGSSRAAPGVRISRNLRRVELAICDPVSGRECRIARRGSRDQHHRSGGLARLDVAMCLRGVAQRIGMVDLDPDLAAPNHIEQVSRGFD